MPFGSGPIQSRGNRKSVTLNDVDGNDNFTVKAADGTPVMRVSSTGDLSIRGNVKKLQ